MRRRWLAAVVVAGAAAAIAVALTDSSASRTPAITPLERALETLKIRSEVFTLAGIGRPAKCVRGRRVLGPATAFSTEGRVSVEHDEGVLVDVARGGDAVEVVRGGTKYDRLPSGWDLSPERPWLALPHTAAATLVPFHRVRWISSDPEPRLRGPFPGLLQLLHAAEHVVGPRRALVAGRPASEVSFSEPVLPALGALSGGPRVRVTVDVAADGLPVRVVESTHGGAGGDETSAYSVVAVDAPIAPVSAPPASQTITIPEAVALHELRAPPFGSAGCGRPRTLVLR